MVKIINTLGDIKTGVQGRAVYQRKYGQQIRRMREPKRAMASEAQVRHRQLYKAALAWRKSLSLANRRSLDGYAIANWIVDDHNIPLPWHRFALKLYLEHVHFTLLSKPIAPQPGPWQKFESYETGVANYSFIKTTQQTGQTFTPQEGHTLDRIDIHIRRYNSPPGVGHLLLKNVDANHLPIGPPLLDVTFDPLDAHPTTYTWFEIPCPDHELTAGIEVGIYCYTSTESPTAYLMWRYGTNGSNYPYGMKCSSYNSGVDWATQPTDDMNFKEYGTLAGGPGQPGELDIRHPGLQTITKKHEGIVIPQFDHMSNISEGRLTNYINLSADAGDLIEATTIADLISTYQL